MPRSRKNLLLGSGILVLAWVAIVHVAGPWLIRAAYAGRAPAALSRLFTGRDIHPVEHYLDVWGRFAWRLDVLAILALVVWFPGGPARRVVSRMLRAEPTVGASRLLGIAAFWGAVTGIAEGLHVLLRKSIAPINVATFNQTLEAVWLAPIAESLVFLAFGLLAVLATRAWRRPVSLRLVTTLAVLVGAYAVMRASRLGIGVWPARVLALGIAVQAGIWIASRPDTFGRRLPRMLAGFVAWTVLAATALHGGRTLREWWSLRSLPAATEAAPNVVLLILDTVRSTSLSLYGHERPTTPRLEAIARDAVVFDAAIAPASWTLPSHAAILTGHEPWDLSVDWMSPLDDARPTLAEALSRLGYASAGFVANRFYAGRTSGIARGFTRYEEESPSFGLALENSWLARNVVGFIRARADLSPPTAQMHAGNVSDRFLRWAADRDGRPFFAMLNFMDAHTPYEAPDSILARFTSGGPRREPEGGVVYAPAELAEFRANYEAAIAYIDQEIGRIVDSLAARGQLDRTVLIVASDHGEQIGEHDPGLHMHSNSLYAATIAVPLLIRYPAVLPAGLRVRRTVAIRRIAATVMDLVGADGGSFPGPALTTELDTVAGGDDTPVLSFLRPGYATLESEPVAAGPMASVTWKQWHYIRNGDGREELYDWPADPWELDDRVTDGDLGGLVTKLRLEARALEPHGVPREK